MSINPQNYSLALILWHLYLVLCLHSATSPLEGLWTPAEPHPLHKPPDMSELNSEPAAPGKTAENPCPKMHKWPVSDSAKQTQLPCGPDMQISIPLLHQQPQPSLHKVFVLHFQQDCGPQAPH